MEKVPMTIEGFKQLEAELHRLKVEERPRIIQQISEARDHGDLSENAEYHAAKDAQGLNEARVAELEDKLSRAEVIDPAKLSGSTVKFGATVTLEDEDSGDKVKYKIVGEHEANVREGKISITSPIARALIGKSKGDSAEVTTPRGRAQLRDPEDRIQIGARGVSRLRKGRAREMALLQSRHDAGGGCARKPSKVLIFGRPRPYFQLTRVPLHGDFSTPSSKLAGRPRRALNLR